VTTQNPTETRVIAKGSLPGRQRIRRHVTGGREPMRTIREARVGGRTGAPASGRAS